MFLVSSQKVVLACCVLHNMSEAFKDVVPALGIVPAHLLDDDAGDEDEDEDDNDDGEQLTLAHAHRDTYANNFYAAYRNANQ